MKRTKLIITVLRPKDINKSVFSKFMEVINRIIEKNVDEIKRSCKILCCLLIFIARYAKIKEIKENPMIISVEIIVI